MSKFNIIYELEFENRQINAYVKNPRNPRGQGVIKRTLKRLNKPGRNIIVHYIDCIHCGSGMVSDMDGELHCDNDECVASNYLPKEGAKQ